MRWQGFTTLRARLATQYAALFAAAMLLLSAALYGVTGRLAELSAQQQLDSIGSVYGHLWDSRARQLQQSADMLAHDFGFRAAIATHDEATAASALHNLQLRLGVRSAFILSADGRPYGSADLPDAEQSSELWDALDGGKLVGVARIGSTARQIVAAPIEAPQLLGWIVFPSALDQAETNELEKLSPVPINAGFVIGTGRMNWQKVAGNFQFDNRRGSKAIAGGFSEDANGALIDWPGDSFAVIKPLPTLSSDQQAALLLLFPRARAMAAYRPIQAAILTFALLGLLLFFYASWKTASKITEPLAKLDNALGRIAEGHRDQIIITGKDELARLSQQFNHMVDQIEEREAHIRQLAFNDVITGLPNRVMFHEHADLLLERAADSIGKLVLFCLDLDNFKSVNDTMGHTAGDTFLKEIGARLDSACGLQFVARLGGDEFVVLATLNDPIADAEKLAAKIVKVVGQPLTIEGQQLLPSTSIGIAIGGVDGDNVETLLRNGDLALYRAKESGRGTWSFFEQGLNERAQARRKLETDLRLAIERGEFELYFQPLFDLRSNLITTCEALIRWHHPEQGLVSPAAFIPIAESTGMIVEIGSWALRESCRIAASWPESIRVAVNVSAIQFARPGLSSVVVQALTSSGLAPERLEIEITESTFIEDSQATLAILHNLRNLGVRIALDDFGTGYSSLSYLQSFPFDKIKIDRSFIQQLSKRPGAGAVVKAITELAEALGMETTAEGVEETDQLEQLKAQGCTSVQGFLFSRPLEISALNALISDLTFGHDIRAMRAR